MQQSLGHFLLHVFSLSPNAAVYHASNITLDTIRPIINRHFYDMTPKLEGMSCRLPPHPLVDDISCTTKISSNIVNSFLPHTLIIAIDHQKVYVTLQTDSAMITIYDRLRPIVYQPHPSFNALFNSKINRVNEIHEKHILKHKDPIALRAYLNYETTLSPDFLRNLVVSSRTARCFYKS